MWLSGLSASQRVVGSIPRQGKCLGCRPGPRWGVWERQPHIDASLPLFCLPSPLSKNKIFLKIKKKFFLKHLPLETVVVILSAVRGMW